MEIRVSNQPLNQVPADVLLMPMLEGAAVPSVLDEAVNGILATAVGAGDFSGEFGQTALFYTRGLAARKVLLVGLGKADGLSPRKLRRAAGMGARVARQSGAKSLALSLPALPNLDAATVAQFMTEGATHGLYKFVTLKSEQKPQPVVESLTVLGGPEVQAAVAYGRAVAEGVNFARAVNWLPGNHLTSTVLAEKARDVAREAGMEIEVFDKKGCQELGLGLLLAVNQGSVEEPRFIVMRYKGNGGKGPWLSFIGKGLTFDSGGISIKPTDNMWDMKYDMAGAGAVLGAMQAIGKLKPPADILAVIPSTDNMPDGGAYKPGDVVVGLSGKTVEIRSTDAEGRLILADAIAYAVKQGVARMVTAATLTGAAQIALGPIRNGIVANDDAWEDEVYQAAEDAGEPGWKLPHDPEYYELFKSPIADMSNTGVARAAGTVVGGLFLMKHAEKTPLVHLDIAATAWKGTEDKYEEAGATGVGVRTFVRTAIRFAEGNK